MPLTAKGEKIHAAMVKQYGAEKAEEVFYASRNAGTITGVDDNEGHTTIAAGILFCCKKKALFLKRGPGGDHPGEWCFPGGRQEDEESVVECAIREAEEECGKIPDCTLVPWTRACSPTTPLNGGPAPAGVPNVPPVDPKMPPLTDYCCYKMEIKEQFVPVPDAEHVGYAWAPVDQPPEPLHPGCRVALDRFTMDELGIARAIMDGRLCSPQKYENVWLFALRITGTGLAYRHKLKEYVWRDPSIYMNEEFLARCNGLTVIWQHPKGKKAMLDTKEFNDRKVGSIMLPYLRHDLEEVWGIAKIYDEPAAVMMEEEQLSTSPSVVFRDPSVNSQLELESGEKLLIEGKPSLVDHLAICPAGVWDKGGEPVGVLTQAIADSAPRPSSSPWGKLDAAVHRMGSLLLSDAIHRMDSITKK